jgi:hypothetical protein
MMVVVAAAVVLSIVQDINKVVKGSREHNILFLYESYLY